MPKKKGTRQVSDIDITVPIPDYIEPVIGWRAWAVAPGPLLCSIAARVEWPPRQRLEAACGSGEDHNVPDDKCSCGVYAATSKDHLAKLRYAEYDLARWSVVVVGQVALWGGVIPGEQGWRAQFAYPHKLFIPYECWRLVEPLREDYGVQAVITNTFKLLRKAA